MKTKTMMFAIAAGSLALSGCSTTGGVSRTACAAAGALVAGAAASAAAEDDEAQWAALGAVVGAGAGYFLCPGEAEPVAVAAAPEPEPAPAPAPEPEACPDADGDGVCDADDRCPGTRAGVKVDAKGCPDIPDLSGVNFEFDSAKLNGSASSILNEGAAVIKDHPEIRVEVQGHTDSVGSEAYNQKLSEKRAESVKSYLEGQGVESSRISASGKGESDPVATNDTAEGRAANRRVEISAEPR